MEGFSNRLSLAEEIGIAEDDETITTELERHLDDLILVDGFCCELLAGIAIGLLVVLLHELVYGRLDESLRHHMIRVAEAVKDVRRADRRAVMTVVGRAETELCGFLDQLTALRARADQLPRRSGHAAVGHERSD